MHTPHRVASATIVAICVWCAGCNSSKTLATNSRLPGWFQLPAGVQRGDVIVTMLEMPVLDDPRHIWFELTDRKGTSLASARATGTNPYNARAEIAIGLFDFPYFELTTVDAVSELIEVRLGGTFVVSDDASL